MKLLCVLTLLTCLTVGCNTSPSAIAQAQANATTLVQNAQATRTAVATKLSTMPATDPARPTLQIQLDKLDQLISQTQQSLPAFDAAAKSSNQPAIDPAIVQAAGVVPYGSLAVALLGLLFGVIKQVQNGNLVDKQQNAEKAFEQIVGALDAALPTPTPDQQARVNAVLDTDVKAKVAAVRTS